jgi:hypothetical protein
VALPFLNFKVPEAKSVRSAELDVLLIGVINNDLSIPGVPRA